MAADGPPKCTILSVAEGRAFLEEEVLIGSDEGLDLCVMAGALIQISAMKDVPATARCAVQLITLILAQLKLESVSEVVANTMEKSLKALLAKTVEKVTDSLKDSIESLISEIRAASTNVATSTTQIAAMTTSYRDALKNSPSLVGRANTMDVCVCAREGVKARQLLIDTRAPGQGLLSRVSNVGLVDAANKAIQGMDSSSGYKFVSAKRLNNGGIFLEMNGEAAAEWNQWPRCQGHLSGSTLARCCDQELRLSSGSSVCPTPFQD